MEMVDIILGSALIVASLFLIIAVLMQQGKSKNLSGTIAGGSDTFYGKSKAKSRDKKLSTLTTIIAVIFVGIVLAVYLMQDTTSTKGNVEDPNAPAEVTTVAKDEAPETTTAAK